MSENNNSVWLIACRPSGIIAILLAFGIAILLSNNASAANLISNGDFETGDLTSWTHYAGGVNGASAYSGSYGYYYSINNYFPHPHYDMYIKGISQSIDLTDVDELTYYHSMSGYSVGAGVAGLRVWLDTDTNIGGSDPGAFSYTYKCIDVSGYSGVHDVHFGSYISTGMPCTVTYTARYDDITANEAEPPQYIAWTTYPPDSWKVGNYSALVIGVPEEYKNFVFEYKTPSTNYTTMPIQKNIVPKTFNCAEGKWYYWFSKSVYHTTYGNYSCRITHPEMETETKTVSVPYFDPDVTLPPVVIIPIPDVWVDPPQWNVTIPDKYQNVSWLTDYTVFWDGVGNSTNYTLYATVGLLFTPFEMLNSSISTVHEYATTAGGMIAGFEHTAIIIKVGWDIIPDDIQNIFIGTAALGIVIFIYHRRT